MTTLRNLFFSSEGINALSYIANIVFVTWGVASIFKDRKNRRELGNIFNAEFGTAKKLSESIKDPLVRLHIEHTAEFLKAFTRSLGNRRHDEVGGDHHNFFIRWLENKFK